jgi:3D (Asp-Asp-Asp) domain-containing protein
MFNRTFVTSLIIVLIMAIVHALLVIDELQRQLDQKDDRIQTLETQIKAQTVPEEVSIEPPREVRVHVGTFKITHYDPWVTGTNRTASRKTASDGVGLWIAANPEDFPIGTELYIDGYGYRTVEDTGVPQGTLDVLVENEDVASQMGVKRGVNVWRIHRESTAQE